MMFTGQKNPALNKHMVSAIIVIGKRQQDIYIVKSEDWLNARMYVIDAQDPYSGDSKVILKSDFRAMAMIDENGETNYFERR